MLKIKHSKGFTIVELLIVIVVIGILAGLVFVQFNNAQARARDTKIKSAMAQFEKALHTWAVDHGNIVRGGSGSTTPASNGECANGASGFVGSTTYACTVEDALVSAGMLQPGFIAALPRNTHYSTPTNGRLSVMFYFCGAAGSGRYGLYWTLEAPTAEDTANIDSTVTTCGHAIVRDSYGMRGGKIVQF